MKKQTIIFFIIFITLIILFTVIFLFMNNSSKDNNIVSKTEEEIDYLEEKIIAIMNSLNQINFSNTVLVEEKVQSKGQNEQSSGGAQGNSNSSSGSQGQNSESDSSSGSSQGSTSQQNNKETTKYEIKNDYILTKKSDTIDWEYVKNNVETIHSTWATLTIDLHSLNVNNEDILNFSQVLDQVTIDAKGENKTTVLNNLSTLYAFLPNYRKEISEDNKQINIDFVKASVLNSYGLSEQDKWDEMKAQLNNAIVYFTNILNSVNEEQENQNKMSKIYVMLNELNNSIDSKDKDLYLIKYRNVMEELVNF